MRLKKGDEVMVLSGRDKGRRGKILQVMPTEGKVIVEGLNVIKRHTKPTKANPQGGVLEKAAGLPCGKVMLVCANCHQPTRINRQFSEDKLVRICKHCEAILD
ncbi:MAG: 50S ribosomal protein L24 [Bacillota bacterium]